MAPAKTQKAVWSVKDQLQHVELAVSAPDAGEVLIRNVCVASNPKGTVRFHAARYSLTDSTQIGSFLDGSIVGKLSRETTSLVSLKLSVKVLQT